MFFYKKSKKLYAFFLISILFFIGKCLNLYLLWGIGLVALFLAFFQWMHSRTAEVPSTQTFFPACRQSSAPASKCATTTVDLMIIIDENNADLSSVVQSILSPLAEQFSEGQTIRVGIIGYGHCARLLHPLQPLKKEGKSFYFEEIKQSAHLHAGNNLQDAVRMGRTLLKQSNADQRVFLLITDGNSTWWLNSQEKPVTKGYLCEDKVFSGANQDIVAAQNRRGGIISSRYQNFEQFRQIHREQILAWDENEGELENLLAGTLTIPQGYTSSDWKKKDRYPYMAIEKGVLMASEELLQAIKEGVRLICVGDDSDSGEAPSAPLRNIRSMFLDWTAQIGQLYRYRSDAENNKTLETVVAEAVHSLHWQ